MAPKNKSDSKIQSVRMPAYLDGAISEQAKKNERSINSEIVFRLKRSFEQEQAAA